MAFPPIRRTGGAVVARPFGIAVRIDPSWMLSLGILSLYTHEAIVADLAVGAPLPVHLALSVFFALPIVVCIVLHELAHSVVARSLGIPVRRITLFAFGGVSEMEREAPTAHAEALVAIAGPLTSVAIAAVLAAAARITEPVPDLSRPLAAFAWVNLYLALFNLIPAFPMDGGRLLRSLLWIGARNRARATRWAAIAGRAFALTLIIGGGVAAIASVVARNDGFAGGMWGVMLGLFLYGTARSAGDLEGGERPNEARTP